MADKTKTDFEANLVINLIRYIGWLTAIAGVWLIIPLAFTSDGKHWPVSVYLLSIGVALIPISLALRLLREIRDTLTEND